MRNCQLRLKEAAKKVGTGTPTTSRDTILDFVLNEMSGSSDVGPDSRLVGMALFG